MKKPETDFEAIDFGDKRITRRLCKAMEAIRQNAGKSVLGTGEANVLPHKQLHMGLRKNSFQKQFSFESSHLHCLQHG